MFQPWIMLFIQLVCLSQLRGVCGQNGPQFVLEMTLHSYLDSNSTDTTGLCCRPSNNCNQGCRNMFNVCAQEDESSNPCNYGERSFNHDSLSGVTVNFGQFLETDVLLNPVSFSPDIGQWPGAFRVVVSVTNTQRTQALIDRFTISRNTFNSDEMVTETIIGEFGNTLGVSILLRCTDSFTGANCDQAVVATTVPANTNVPSTTAEATVPATTNTPPTTAEATVPATTNVPSTTAEATTPNSETTPDTIPPSTTLPMATTSLPGQTTTTVKTAATSTSASTIATATNTTASTEDTTAPSNTTLGGGNPQASGLSEGGVAGLVIGLLIGSVLVVIAIVLVIWWYKKKSSASFKISDPAAAKQSLENPNYVMVTMNNSAVSSSNVSPAPVYNSTSLYETVDIERTLDNDNPLYFSMEASNDDYAIPPDAMPAKPAQIDEDDYDLPPDEQGYPPLPVKPPRIDEADYDLPPGEQGYPLPPSQPPPPPHSLSSNQLNPYGEYGDGTIRRVASQQSVNCEVFDNPDYCEPSALDISS